MPAGWPVVCPVADGWAGVVCDAEVEAELELAVLLLSSPPVSSPPGHTRTMRRMSRGAPAPASHHRRSVGTVSPPLDGERGSRAAGVAARRPRSPSGIAGTEPFS